MSEVFLKVLNMSIAASWLILAVVVLRLMLKRAPKWIAVLLWGIVALRLAVPFSFESALSLIPSAETFSPYNIQYETPAISSGIPTVNNVVNPILGEAFAPNPGGSINPLYLWTFVVSIIWLMGIAAMLLYAVISYMRVHRSVEERVPYEGNIFLCDHVKSPFILGLVRPKIYLPSGMEAAAMESVIAHERAHLARRDHWWKPLGFLILTVHWFNPLCWIAYVLLCRDIELACDEKTIRQMDLDGKKQYSTALLECSAQRRLVTICPLAFGEVGVKERVKNVLNYKKPAFWVIILAVIACGVVTVCFATNPKQDISQEQYTVQAQITEVENGSFLVAPVEGSPELSSSDLFRVPITNMPSSPEPLVGDVVEITYDGSILESYPAQFGTIYSMKVVSRETSPEMDVAGTTLSDEQTTIRQAILEHNRSADPTGLVSCASFAELACLSGTPLVGNNTHKITYYGWALYEEYKVTDNGLETVGGSHLPVALSFDLDERGYTLTEYWEPRDGSYYAQDIREKFPSHVVEDGMDSQKFILRQTQECYAQAVAATGLDTNKVIEKLIETICSSPALSSNPEDYIKEHSTEYRELTYYGRYTLKYCFDQFEKGGETGLDGQIMSRAYEDIAVSWGEDGLRLLVCETPADGMITGQMWYNAFKNNALNLMEQYSEIELAERYPASYLLLSMLGEV